ncbi:MAG: bacteriocin family protein [Firmicutes bacterium]|nr:bacteriocin family protein [Bacillota bacterium]
MDFLKRELAPITAAAWEEIESRAIETLKSYLSARKIVNVVGPKGFDYAYVGDGGLASVQDDNGVETGIRSGKPLVEVRVPFELDLCELDSVDRGSQDVDLAALEDAVRKIALYEDQAVFYGLSQGSIEGLIDGSSNEPIPFGTSPEDIMRGIAKGVITLKEAFAEPPYALAVGHEAWLRIMADSHSYPLRRRIQDLIEGPIILSHALKEAVLVPHKHEDLELTLGSDLAIGYETHNTSSVRLYITETFTFRILEPAIIVTYTL